METLFPNPAAVVDYDKDVFSKNTLLKNENTIFLEIYKEQKISKILVSKK